MRRPLSGAIVGILMGLALAIALQRQGIWPLDQLTVFLVPAVAGLLGMLILSVGRTGSTVTLVIALILLVPMAIWGALGFTDFDEGGGLNGGCVVTAASDVDTTIVSDTSKQEPFAIDPDGGLTWVAESPVVFMDYDWEIFVRIGGFEIVLDSGTEPNEEGSQINGDDVGSIRQFAAQRDVDVDALIGVHEVGGFAATCDGLGFVQLLVDGLDLVTGIALMAMLLLLVILIILMITGRGKVVVGSATVVGSGDAADTNEGLSGHEPGAEDLPSTDDLA